MTECQIGKSTSHKYTMQFRRIRRVRPPPLLQKIIHIILKEQMMLNSYIKSRSNRCCISLLFLNVEIQEASLPGPPLCDLQVCLNGTCHFFSESFLVINLRCLLGPHTFLVAYKLHSLCTLCGWWQVLKPHPLSPCRGGCLNCFTCFEHYLSKFCSVIFSFYVSFFHFVCVWSSMRCRKYQILNSKRK